MTPEHVVFIRLQLIEAILQYHAQQPYIAKALLNQLEQKVKCYIIDDSELVNLLAMGFTTKESKAALKACKRDQEQAASYVLKKREEARLKREADEKRKEEKKESRKYGKTADGKWVDAAVVKGMMELGFNEYLAAEGMRQTNNNQQEAMNLLLSHPELLRKEDKPKDIVSEEAISQIVASGYSRNDATRALQATHGNLQKAFNRLLDGTIIRDTVMSEAIPAEQQPITEKPATEVAETVETEKLAANLPLDDEILPDSQEDFLDPLPKTEEEIKAEEEKKLKQQIEDEIVDSIPIDDETVFDVDMNEIVSIINEYKVLLQSK